MYKYGFQFRLHTLALCAVIDGRSYDNFKFEGLEFIHWQFNFQEDHKTGAWLIKGEIEASNMKEAHRILHERLNDLIPKIAMISQCYTEYENESFLIHRLDTDIAYFYYTRRASPVPLSFDEASLEALDLLKKTNIPNEFFYYWNDMVNTAGYPAKLLLICSALEALGKASGKTSPEEKGNFRVEVLGKELSRKIFKKTDGIRHRLVHGEYFSSDKDGEDYLGQIYEKIIQYFESTVFSGKPLIRRVVNPQRHFWGNKERTAWHIKKDPSAAFDLREMVAACDKNLDDFYSSCTTPSDEEKKNL